MKKLPLFLFCSVFYLFVNAQDSKWSIGINGSIDYSYHTIHDVEGTTISGSMLEDRKDTDEPRIGWATGMDVRYEIKPCLNILSGLRYSEQGFSHTLDNLAIGVVIDPTSGAIDESYSGPIVAVEYLVDCNYFEMPLALEKCWGTGRLKARASTGLIIALFVRSDSAPTYIYANETRRFPEPMSIKQREVHFMGQAGAGVVYSLSERLNVSLDLIGSHSFNYAERTRVGTLPWRIGLQAGCQFRL